LVPRVLVGLKVEQCGFAAIVNGFHSCVIEEQVLRVLHRVIGPFLCTLSARRHKNDVRIRVANTLYYSQLFNQLIDRLL